MSYPHFASVRRGVVATFVMAVGHLGSIPSVHAEGTVAFPIYRAEHALSGIYTHQFLPLWRSFERDSAALTQAARKHCDGQAQAAELSAAWSRARLAWLAASNPALGPVVTRRSQREIDFWPVRPALLQRALNSKSQSLAQMERVGGPAKGFPTMEALLAEAPSPTHCPYLVLIAEGIEAEAKALTVAFAEQSAKDWAADEGTARSAFAECVNQWLGGLESLRWQQIEQPVQKALTAGAGQSPAFARRTMAENLADWQAQWASLRAQARLTPEQRNAPPTPGRALLPIEALLLGKGHIALAERWGKAVDAASAAMTAIPDRPSERNLLALSQALKGVTSLYQSEVAAALDVPLGFSSADGD
jgi:hypothetical protein